MNIFKSISPKILTGLIILIGMITTFSPASSSEETAKLDAKVKKSRFVDLEPNFMWLNAKLDKEQYGLFGDKEKESVTIKALTSRAQANSDLLPPVIVWYDADTTSKKALECTQSAMKDSLQALKTKTKGIVFRNIWTIKYIQAHSSVFGKEQDIYFKADLVRLVVTLRQKSNDEEDGPKYVMYSDLNIPPFSLSQMFYDESHKVSLSELPTTIMDKYGFVLSSNEGLDDRYLHENAFHILNSENEIACQTFWFALVQINCLRGQNFVDEKLWTKWDKEMTKKKSQIIFESYTQMMKYYYYLQGVYGIGDDPDKMPKTVQARIKKFSDPAKLFYLDGTSMKNRCNYYGVKNERQFVGFGTGGQSFKRNGVSYTADQSGYITVPRQVSYTIDWGKPESLEKLTIRVGKPTSNFYK